jgi:SAM-dependent methyltransferase
VPHVTAIDRDEASIDVARRQDDEGIDYILGDFLTHPFQPASFDLIASIAALHHMDAAAALERMRGLLAPGGTLAIVGLARNRYPADLPFVIAGAVGHRVHRLSKPCWDDSAPRAWPPPDTYAQTRRLARRLLPGVRYRRLLLWRYSLVWTKPA